MKKLFGILLAALLLVLPVFADETAQEENVSGRVEIEFCVGDATLLINGQEVTVEKPYVVGEGVTLVPVRVITEAFGAEVGWVKETKTITLDYPDVNIVLQIGNPTAEINGRAETLLAAPELTENGFTMVPLRFISENFGAEVGYDNTTKRITVVKETTEESATVEGAIENKYIGDSYYGWSMENPKDMIMDEREFDGSYISFAYDESNFFYIGIHEKEEDYNFEQDFVTRKASIGGAGYTLVKADKNTDGDPKKMHFQAKDKEYFLDLYVIESKDYKFVIYGAFDVTDSTVKDECIRVLSTFETGVEKEDMYDFSNVKNGYRRFESEEMKFGIDIPENFYLEESGAINEFNFYTSELDDNQSRIHVCVFSKSDVTSAEELAKYDFDNNKKHLNKEMVEFSNRIYQKTRGNFSCYEYYYTKDTGTVSSNAYDIFFELGEYVYNISFEFDEKYDNHEAIVGVIMDKFTAEELNPDEVGILMRNLPESTGTFEIKLGKMATLELPNNYVKVSDSMYMSGYNGVIITYTLYTDDKYRYSDVKEIMRLAEDGIETDEMKVVSATKEVKTENNKYQTFTVKMQSEEEVSYIEQYMTVNSGDAYSFAVYYPGIGYSEAVREEVLEILDSLSFE